MGPSGLNSIGPSCWVITPAGGCDEERIDGHLHDTPYVAVRTALEPERGSGSVMQMRVIPGIVAVRYAVGIALCALYHNIGFFNQLIAAFSGWKDARNDPSKAITFGDGSTLDSSDVEKASSLAEELTFDVPWQAGDLVLVDNYVAMHGRRSFTGTRKVMASLVAD